MKRTMRAGVRWSVWSLVVTTAVAVGADASGAQGSGPSAASADASADLIALRDRAIADTTAWSVLESLTTEVGARPAGSAAYARARDWAVAKLTALGFKNVHAEGFTLEGWTRGEESAQVVAPYPQKLVILGLGGTTSTPSGGIEAEIALFKTYRALLDVPAGALVGKIAVVTEPMGSGFAGYAALSAARRQGPSEAAKRGALAYMHRSLASGSSRFAHTGLVQYSPDAPRIPAAALSPPDAQLLERMAQRGKPIRLHLILRSETHPAESWNIVGEIPGATDEVVLVGAHLDSWDVGTGANDDGAGVAIAVAAAKLAGEARLRRTLRVVLFGGEEIQVAGPAYVEYDKERLKKIVVAGEADQGSTPAIEVALPQGGAGHPALENLTRVLSSLGVTVSKQPASIGGADLAPMNRLGVPALWVTQPLDEYFKSHHTEDDTLDKVAPDELAQNVAVWSVLLRALADAPIEFRATTRAAN